MSAAFWGLDHDGFRRGMDDARAMGRWAAELLRQDGAAALALEEQFWRRFVMGGKRGVYAYAMAHFLRHADEPEIRRRTAALGSQTD